MHNKKKAVTTLLPLALASAIGMTLSQSAVAEIMLYDKDDTTFDKAFVVAKVGATSKETGTDLERIACTVTEREGNFFLVFNKPVVSNSKPVLVSSDVFKEYPGATLTAHAFDRSIPGLGTWLVLIAAWLFAISTMISWSYYGLKAWTYLFGESRSADISYKVLFCVMVIVGSAISAQSVFDFGDAMIFAMCFPNVLGLFILAPEVRDDLADYFKRVKSGEIKQYK